MSANAPLEPFGMIVIASHALCPNTLTKLKNSVSSATTKWSMILSTINVLTAHLADLCSMANSARCVLQLNFSIKLPKTVKVALKLKSTIPFLKSANALTTISGMIESAFLASFLNTSILQPKHAYPVLQDSSTIWCLKNASIALRKILISTEKSA